jgi:thiamine biosynthesis lipoprotein
MGTTVSIDVRDPGVPLQALDDAIAVLEELDARFSTYRADSEISRIGRGELAVAESHADVREVLDACAVLRAESDGAFDAWRDGRLDPSGYVKGWAAERAAAVLRASGARRFTVNLGGDVICAGGSDDGTPWRVGVRHPDDAHRMALVLGVPNGAVATSGRYERGDHVVDARTGEARRAWASITVLAPDLATADAVATAALAMGSDGPAWAAARPTCAVAAIDPAGRLWTSPALEAARLA